MENFNREQHLYKITTVYIPEWKTHISEIIHWTGFTVHWTSQKK